MAAAAQMVNDLSRLEPWNVDEHHYPVDAPATEQFQFLLRYAILAPSVHNTQPWTFDVTQSEIRVFANIAAWLEVADRDQRDLYVSIGCAIENLLIAAAHFGWKSEVKYAPEPNNSLLVAAVKLTKQADAPPGGNADLFKAIVRRHTDHGSYDPEPVADSFLHALHTVVTEPELSCSFISDVNILSRLTDLMIKADATQFANSNYVAELEHWMSQGVFSTAWLLKKLSRLAIKVLQSEGAFGQNYWIILKDAPVVGAICSSVDDMSTRLESGRVFERLFLKATAVGLSLEPITHVLQVPDTRKEVAEIFDACGKYPQVVFRLGFRALDQTRSLRQPIESVLLQARPPLSTPPEYAVTHRRGS